MFNRIFIAYSCFLVLGGCLPYNPEPMPEIAQPATPKVVLPSASGSSHVPANLYKNIPASWLPPSRLEKKWLAIVIHHSATRKGSAAIFDKWHREGRHWEGVGYNFVIGNGTDSSDGQLEVTFRWRQQRAGAHCGGTYNNWANEKAIGICLVGNFNHTTPTLRQMQSLVKLVRFLQSRYGIPKSRIYGHGTTPGARKTDCPGKKFSMAKLKSMLSF